MPTHWALLGGGQPFTDTIWMKDVPALHFEHFLTHSHIFKADRALLYCRVYFCLKKLVDF